MSKVMLINVSHEEESRVAIVQGGVLESLEIESISRSLKGNIYKGVVNNVNVALEAAFVSYGDERAAFLPLDEVNFKVLPAVHAREGHRRGRITDHLIPGKEILVQVVRDAFNSKPPTLSTFYSLPGRYLVLTPKADGQGISRKIEDSSQRDRLKKIVEELNPPEGYGVIVRTAGMDQSKTELQRDLRYLLRLWESIEAAAATHRAPSLIYQERDIVLRTIRDHFTPDIEEVLIDDEDVYAKARRFVQAVMPTKEKVFKLYTGDKPLFSKYNLEDQIESIFRREVTLKSGGAIVIDETEALTAIDVNSARSGREGNIEDTALNTNLEAAEEVARQLRLRDLGGLIVIDFIDMYHDKNVRAVEKTMREALKKDKAKYDVTRISKFGLMEISRQRMKVAKASAAYTPCGRCEGTGVVKTTEAAALSILRRIQARVVKGDLATLRATVPEEVAVYLLNQKREELSGLERRYGTRVSIVPHATMNPNRGEIETVVREGSQEPAAQHAQQRPLVSDEIVGGPREVEEEPDEAVAGVPSDRMEEPSPAVAVAGEEERPAIAAPGGIATAPAAAPGRKRRRRRRRSKSEPGTSDTAGIHSESDQPEAPEQRGEIEVGVTEPGGEHEEEGEREYAHEGYEEARLPLSAADAKPDTWPGIESEPDEGEIFGEEPPSTRVGGETEAPEGRTPTGETVPGGPESPAGEAPAGPHRRRRRRRRRSRRPAGSTPAVAAGGVPLDEPGAPAPGGSRLGDLRLPQTPPSPSTPGEEKEEEEEIPGGWWQRLTGGSRRGGRGDQQD